jgi:hypothetical protein
MKLRIDSTQIRFRLSEQEAEKLLAEKNISETLYLPLGQRLNYSVKIADDLSLHYEDDNLVLSVSNEALKNLIQNPSKKGLSSTYQEQNKNILFSLQIDLACDFNC